MFITKLPSSANDSALRLRIFSRAHRINCVFLQGNKDNTKVVQGTKLALCVRAQTPKPKRERIECLQIPGGLAALIPINQSEEKITK
jgi:hypothetical protein